MAIRWQIFFFSFSNFSCRLIFHEPLHNSHCSYFFTSETQWRWGIKRIRKVQTGWERSTWGPRPWRGASPSTPSCWSPKRCWVTRCSSTGQRCSAKPSIPRFHNRWVSHDHNHTAATWAQTVIFSCTKARWPTKNERIRKRVTGYEGKSSWAALHVWAGEAGKWYNRMIASLWSGQVSPHDCYLHLQKNARVRAEEMFRDKLKKYGITELFIQQHGEQNEEESSSSRLNDNADESDPGSSRYAKGLFLARFFMYWYRSWENYE